MFNIILFEPEIPPNTGNIIRQCANTGSRLHLVKPLGFEVTDKTLLRAGLDYRELANISFHENLEACLHPLAGHRIFAVETKCEMIYSEVRFEPGDAFMFGKETSGLPPAVLARVPPGRRLSIPMLTVDRSLNLSNSVAVVVYEAWRQNGFAVPAVQIRSLAR